MITIQKFTTHDDLHLKDVSCPVQLYHHHDSTIFCIPQQPVKVEVDKLHIREEIIKTVQPIKSDKVADADGISTEIYKFGNSCLSNSLGFA